MPDLIQAFQERYETASGLPEFFSGMKPEHTSITLAPGNPNHVLEHLGEEPKYQADGQGNIVEAEVIGNVISTFYAATFQEANEMGRLLHAVMKNGPLTIEGDIAVQAERGKYRVMKTTNPFAPSGSYVYAAITPYRFCWTPED